MLSQVIIVAAVILTSPLVASSAVEPLVVTVAIGTHLRFTTILDNIGAAVMGVEEWRQMMSHLGVVTDVELMAEPREPSSLLKPGVVEPDDVVFGYCPDVPVSAGAPMRVSARTVCVIANPSGSGRTTTARFVARPQDMNSRTVRADGINMRDMSTSQLMEQFSMAFQDVHPPDDTLVVSIRIGNPAVDDTQMYWAVDLAGVAEIVDRLSHGWDMRTGEGGQALSDGECQRVFIVRTLFKRAPIVLFGEAISAPDTENEANIVTAMQELRRTSTLTATAHRLETIATVDQVVALDDAGRIVRRGHHNELVSVKGPYRSFWEQHTRARGWALASRQR